MSPWGGLQVIPGKFFVLKHLKAKFLLDDIKICGLLYVGLEVLDMKKLDNRWSKGESHWLKSNISTFSSRDDSCKKKKKKTFLSNLK